MERRVCVCVCKRQSRREGKATTELGSAEPTVGQMLPLPSPSSGVVTQGRCHSVYQVAPGQ